MPPERIRLPERFARIESKDPESQLDNVLVTLSSNPSFLKPKTWRLDRIAPEGTVSIKDRDIELDGSFLLNLADSMRGSVTITVEQNGTVIAQETKPVELLAYNEWGGAGYMPELLAAFSMPNDPAVDRVLRDTSLILRKAGKPDGIDGYKAGSRQRVWEIASAIYTAICKKEIQAIRALLSLSDDPIELARSIGIARLNQGAHKRLSEALKTSHTRMFDRKTR